MTTRDEAILAAVDAWHAAGQRADAAAERVAWQAQHYVTGLDEGASDDACAWNLDALRDLVGKWEAAKAARRVAAGRVGAARRVVLGPLPADSEGGYLREWGAA